MTKTAAAISEKICSVFGLEERPELVRIAVHGLAATDLYVM